MDDMVGGAIAFVVVAVVLIIGGAIVFQTQSVTETVVGTSAGFTTLTGYVVDALTTYASLLPILALAVIGGLALFYVIGFLRGGSRSM